MSVPLLPVRDCDMMKTLPRCQLLMKKMPFMARQRAIFSVALKFLPRLTTVSLHQGRQQRLTGPRP